MIVSVLSDLTWLPLSGGGRKSWYIIITVTNVRIITPARIIIIIMVSFVQDFAHVKNLNSILKTWKVIDVYNRNIVLKIILEEVLPAFLIIRK